MTEPFWVKGNSEAWAEPDDVFVSQGFITAEDRKTFWEMTQALVEVLCSILAWILSLILTLTLTLILTLTLTLALTLTDANVGQAPFFRGG